MNILGGYRFPDAPVIDLSPIEPVSAPPTIPASANGAAADLIATIPDDLSIPEFLLRRRQEPLAIAA